ncbi:MAG: hypothetical protein AMXMBFR53_26390 [Gemmatimonadota bacterium]
MGGGAAPAEARGAGEPRLLFQHAPVPGHAWVPLALLDLDEVGTPEVFLDFSVEDEGLYASEGVAILKQGPGGAFSVQHPIASWRVDTH